MGEPRVARHTRHVIDELFRSAQRRVFIAGYSFDSATELFVPLFDRMTALAEQGLPPLQVDVVLDCSRHRRTRGYTAEQIGHACADRFLKTCWRTDRPRPRLRYYVPSTDRQAGYWGGDYAPHSMHAKCIVVDDDRALVGSANFSTRGRDDRSVEVGTLVRDRQFVQALCASWRAVEPDLAEVTSD